MEASGGNCIPSKWQVFVKFGGAFTAQGVVAAQAFECFGMQAQGFGVAARVVPS